MRLRFITKVIFYTTCTVCWATNNKISNNLLQNPGFEKKKTGWSVELDKGAEAKTEIDSKIQRSETNSLLVRKTNGIGSVVITAEKPVPVKKNLKYEFSLYCQCLELPDFSIGPHGARLTLEVIGHDDDGKSKLLAKTTTRQSVPVLTKPGEWRRLRLWFNPKNNDDIVTVSPYIVISGNPSLIRFDDVSLAIYDPQTDKRPYRWIPPKPKLSWTETLKILEKRPNSCGMMRNVDGLPRFFIDSTMVPPIFYKSRGKSKHGYYTDFNKAGIKVDIVHAPLGGANAEIWKGPGKYDFKPVDSRIKFALQGNPDGHLIVAVRIGPYPGWEADNPSQATRDQNGLPATGQTEREYYGKKKEDSHHEIYSYYSPTFRKMAEQSLKDFLEHVKKQPYYKAIVGFSLVGGQNDQWQTISQPGHLIDYSPGAIISFRKYMKTKYKTKEALRKAIGIKSANFANLKPASAENRTAGIFRNPKTDRLLVDYNEFLSTYIAEMLIGFGKIIKDNAAKPMIVTSYYNDIIKGMGKNNESGRKINNSPYIDMLGSPVEYNPWRQPGGPGSIHSCLKSLSLHNMIWLQELDYHTWISPKYSPGPAIDIAYAMNLDQFTAINEREIGAMIAQNMGAYYYDLSGGHFHDPGIMKNISSTQLVYRKMMMKRNRFRPDLAVVVDEESCQWVAENLKAVSAVNNCLSFVHNSLYVSGVPFDVFQLDDLLAYPALSDYKVYLFLNCFYLNDKERNYIGKNLKKDGKTIVWMYAPGYISQIDKSTENIFNTCGFKVATSGKMEFNQAMICKSSPLTAGLGPLLSGGNAQKFWIEDTSHQVIPLARYAADGKIAAAMKNYIDWTSIYLALPDSLPAKLINNIAKYADAYVCSAAGLTVWVNDNFISIHGTKGGKFELNLPRKCNVVKDPFSGKVISKAEKGKKLEKVTIELPLHKTQWLILE